MYTHKIISKEVENGVLVLGVEFSNGTDVVTEAVKPSDAVGLKRWVKARIASLNSLKELESLNIDDVVDTSEAVTADTRTTQEIAKDEWFVKYRKWVQIKETLIDTGVLIGDEPKIASFLADVKAGFQPAYVDLI